MTQISLRELALARFRKPAAPEDLISTYESWEKMIQAFCTLDWEQVPCRPIPTESPRGKLAKLKSRLMRHLRPEVYVDKLRLAPVLEVPSRPKKNIQGLISGALLAYLMEQIQLCPKVEFRLEDTRPDYVSGDIGPYVAGLNKDHRWIQLGPAMFWGLRQAVVEMFPILNDAFGYPVKVVNVRCWETPSIREERGPNAWHRDYFPPGLFKTFLYLTPPGPETGTTEVQLADGTTVAAEGPAGTYFCFDSNALMHRGVSPKPDKIPQRTILEFTTMPFFTNIADPVIAGLNACYPRAPLLG